MTRLIYSLLLVIMTSLESLRKGACIPIPPIVPKMFHDSTTAPRNPSTQPSIISNGNIGKGDDSNNGDNDSGEDISQTQKQPPTIVPTQHSSQPSYIGEPTSDRSQESPTASPSIFVESQLPTQSNNEKLPTNLPIQEMPTVSPIASVVSQLPSPQPTILPIQDMPSFSPENSIAPHVPSYSPSLNTRTKTPTITSKPSPTSTSSFTNITIFSSFWGTNVSYKDIMSSLRNSTAIVTAAVEQMLSFNDTILPPIKELSVDNVLFSKPYSSQLPSRNHWNEINLKSQTIDDIVRVDVNIHIISFYEPKTKMTFSRYENDYIIDKIVQGAINNIVNSGDLQKCLRSNCGEAPTSSKYNELLWIVVCSEDEVTEDGVCIQAGSNARSQACKFDTVNWNNILDTKFVQIWFWFIFLIWIITFISSFSASISSNIKGDDIQRELSQRNILYAAILSAIRVLYYLLLIYGSNEFQIRTCGEVAIILPPMSLVWQNQSVSLYILFYILLLLERCEDIVSLTKSKSLRMLSFLLLVCKGVACGSLLLGKSLISHPLFISNLCYIILISYLYQ